MRNTDIDKKILDMFISVLEGNPSESERAEFVDWLNKSSQNRKMFMEYKKIWEASKPSGERFGKDQAWRNVSLSNIQTSGQRTWMNNFIKVAAILLLFVSVYSVYKVYNINNIIQTAGRVTFSTTPGNISTTVLPDGSEVKLNADTKLEYCYNFKTNIREVKLNGEAFFKVTKSDEPFTVKADNILVKVYGTEFNIKAFSDEKEIVTTLKEGSVSVTNLEANTKEYYLKPNYQFVYKKQNKEMEVSRCNLNWNLDWVDNKLVVRNMSLLSLSQKLERVYNVKIKFKDEKIKAYHYSGMFDNETIDEVLQVICKASNINYKINDRIIVFY